MTDFLFMVGGSLFAMFVIGIVEYGKSEWVGLTWNDVPEEWVGNVAFMEGAKWAGKQLKEKNNG